MEGCALIGIQVMAGKLTTSHTTDRMDEIAAEEIFKPVLIRVVCIGAAVELVGRRILPTLLITSVL